MKKSKAFILAVLLSFTFPLSSESLPGQSEAQIKNWIAKHPFIEPEIFPGAGSGCDPAFYAKRKLKNKRILLLGFSTGQYCSPGFDGLSVYEYLEQKNPTQELIDAGVGYYPTVVFEPHKYLDIWQRDNKGALEVLSQVYKPAIASDFQTSKLVYQGAEYGCSFNGGYHRSKLVIGDCRDAIMPYFDVAFYLGKLYVYEVRKEKSSYEDSPAVITLYVTPLSDLYKSIDILKSNERLFTEISNKKKPADIDF